MLPGGPSAKGWQEDFPYRWSNAVTLPQTGWLGGPQ
jgi:hypothetical protein